MVKHLMEKNYDKDVAILYQKYNDFQTEKGFDLINQLQIKAGKQILDIGCGTGELTYVLARKVSSAGKIFAIEPDVDRLKLAINHQISTISSGIPQALNYLMSCQKNL
ncbi:methyltransferase domain-containing protein [Legionella sp. CNM-1927-20]|uniref:methyltransferase domain-containing protein n=1 Tax=Legionella sp. CNM-1927-20 TaxID=3422221 RepID=UPI00403B27CD